MAQEILGSVLEQISEYARRLELPIPLPVTTDHVASYDVRFHPSDAPVKLTSGYTFVQAHGYIRAFQAPYAFFTGRLDGRIEDYWGTWRMSQREAIQLARETIMKLGYSPELLHMHRRPEGVIRPIKIGVNDIPRYRVIWMHWVDPSESEAGGGIVSHTLIEVDADKKEVKSIAIIDPVVRPPNDLPPP